MREFHISRFSLREVLRDTKKLIPNVRPEIQEEMRSKGTGNYADTSKETPP